MEQRQLDVQPHVQPNLPIQGKGIGAKHEMCLFSNACQEIGSGGRDRTYDQLINSQLLYR